MWSWSGFHTRVVFTLNSYESELASKKTQVESKHGFWEFLGEKTLQKKTVLGEATW